MIGANYWSTGIKLTYQHSGTDGNRVSYDGWFAESEFMDGGWCDDDADSLRVSTEGRVISRYGVRDGAVIDGLTAVLDVLKADVERMGIQWREPTLYYRGDGEDENYPPPDGWREMLARQCDRLGWRAVYRELA